MVATKRQKIEIEKFHLLTLLSHVHGLRTNQENFYRTVLIDYQKTNVIGSYDLKAGNCGRTTFAVKNLAIVSRLE